MEYLREEWGVAFNVAYPTNIFRVNSKLWLHLPNPGGDNDRFMAYGHSRSGRCVHTWIGARYVHNVRVKWVPQHLRASVWCLDSKDLAQRYCDGVALAVEREHTKVADSERDTRPLGFGKYRHSTPTEVAAQDPAYLLVDAEVCPVPICSAELLSQLREDAVNH